MFNLNEEWKKAYAEYLEEEESDFDKELNETMDKLIDVNEDIKEGFNLLSDYFNLLEYSEGMAPVGSSAVISDGSDNKPFNDTELNKTNKSTSDVLKGLMKLFSDISPDALQYKPEATYTVQNISDMKFPKNVIFFIQQLIKWIKNMILFFIEKFKNLIRRLIGDEASVTKINYDKLKLNLEKAKKVETISSALSIGKPNGVISAKVVNSNEVIPVLEGFTDSIIDKTEPEKTAPKRIIVSIDLSRDIETLKILVQHFFELFDYAYGTFNEKLFGTEDLELVLNIFKNAITGVQKGETARTFMLAGSQTEIDLVNAARVKENLIATNQNINDLKEKYVETVAKIKDIMKIINSKELLAMSDLGVSYKILTESTLRQLKPIIDVLPERYKEAKQLEKSLSEMQTEYQKMVKMLSSLQRSAVSVSNITYDSSYNKKIQNLFVASKFMSDIVTLRLSGLGLYIKELKEINEMSNQLLDMTADLSKIKIK